MLDDALGSCEVMGVSVGVDPCDPLQEWNSGTRLGVRPTTGDQADGVAAIRAVLAERGLTVETVEPASRFEEFPSYSADYPRFDGVWFWWETSRNSGLSSI